MKRSGKSSIACGVIACVGLLGGCGGSDGKDKCVLTDPSCNWRGDAAPSVVTSDANKGLGDGVLGSPCDVLVDVPRSQAVYNPQALECDSRICLKPSDHVGGDTGPFCSANCQSDSDCVGALRGQNQTTDKRCVGGFTCAVPFEVGPLCCKRLCLCKDFLAGGVGPTAPSICAVDGGCTSSTR